MKVYVGVTDDNGFDFLAQRQPDEVSFWRPGGAHGFHVLQPGEPFLFKLHSPNNYIAGGGFFVRHVA
jgi:putative restriction endonuclease